MIRPTMIVALVAMLAACDATELPRPEFVTVSPEDVVPPDSLDWAVFSDSPALGDPWTVGDGPILEIGASDGVPEQLFASSRLTEAIRLSDGRIAVLDAVGSKEIRYFTGEGVYLQTFGGAGDGPGEFQGPLQLIPQRADSIAVYDWGLRRVTLIDSRGLLSTTTTVADLPQPSVFARLDDGSFVARSEQGGRVVNLDAPGSDPPGGRVTRTLGAVWHVDSTGQPIDRVSPYEGLLLSPYGAVMPFSTYDVVAFWNGRVVHGDPDTYTFRSYNLDGSLHQIVSRRVTRRRISADELAEIRDRDVESARARRDPGLLEDVMRRYESGQIPAHHAGFGPMIVDRVGNLWVGDFDPTPEGVVLRRPTGTEPAPSWTVFGPDGRWITDVDVPGDLLVTDVGDDYVLGVAPGEFSVPYVRLYSLTK